MEEQVKKKKNRRHVGLRFKFIMGLIIVGLIIALSTEIVGVNIYRHSIEERYTDMAYKIADTAIHSMEEEEIAAYAQAAEDYLSGKMTEEELLALADSDRYREVKKEINNLRKSMNANDVFLCVLDYDILTHYDAELDAKDEWLPLCYIMDCYYEEELDFLIGGRSPILTEFIDILIEATNTGVHPSTFIVSNTENFGYITTAVQPIVIDGKTVAFCSVEIPMSTLQSDVDHFIAQSSLTASLVTGVLLIISIVLLVIMMIKPIVFVAGEAERFTQNNSVISDKLDKIKTHDEIQTLSENLLKLEIGINEYIDNLTRVTAENERIGAELALATNIQSSMLPNIYPPFPDRTEFDIFASMNPAKEVGGDFYDFFLIDDDHLALLIADVSGKGVPAALFMMSSKIFINDHALMGGTPAEILSRVNQLICANNKADMFVTVWLGILEISTGKLTAANAGHEYPLLKTNGKFELLKDKHGMAVGAVDFARYKNYEIQLNKGDSIFVYTDGVAEANNAQEELFGMERTLEALNKDPDASPKEICQNVRAAVDSFVKDTPQFDDITMLGFKYYGTDEK